MAIKERLKSSGFDEITTKEKAKAIATDAMKDIIRKTEAAKNETNDPFFVASYRFEASGISGYGHREEIEVTDTCPEPVYDQIVFKYDPKIDGLELEWVLPSEQIAIVMYGNRFNPNMQKDELMPYVMDKISGKLIEKVKAYNSILIEKVKNE